MAKVGNHTDTAQEMSVLADAAFPIQPDNSTFQPYTPSHPKLVAKLSIEIAPEPPPKDCFSSIKAFAVTLVDANGQPTQAQVKHNHFIEFRKHQDVLDLVVYTRGSDGNTKLAVTECLRVPVAARHILSDGKLSEESGIMCNLPGNYIRRVDGVFDVGLTALEILEKKIGVPKEGLVSNTPLMTGGSYFPSIGGSTEAGLMLALEVKPEYALNQVKFGKGFDGHRRVDWLSPQAVVDGFLKGDIQDLRLVLAAFRISRMLGESIHIDSKLAQAAEFDISQLVSGIKPIKLQDASTWLNEPAQDKPDSAKVKLLETREPQPTDFLKSSRVRVQNINAKGETLGEPYFADIAKRRTTDCVVASGHCWIKTGDKPAELYMAVVQNLRPAIEARELVSHPIHGETASRVIECVAGSLEEGDSDIESIMQRAISEINEEAGIQISGEPKHIGKFYPSPGTNPEIVNCCVVAVDPTTSSNAEHTADEAIKRGLMRPCDIIELAEQGLILDPKLELMAHFLANASKTEKIHKAIEFESIEERSGFNELNVSGSLLDKELAERALQVNLALSEDPVFRHLKLINEDWIGTVILHPQSQSDSAVFDNMVAIHMLGALPSGTYQKERNPSSLAFDLGHDLFHFAAGGILPFQRNVDGTFKRSSKNQLIPMEYEAYKKAMLDLECAAVWFSDVYLPERLGFERAEEVFGGPTLGAALSALGYQGQDAFNMVLQIASIGIIPGNVANHPDFDLHKKVLVERAVWIYYRDAFKGTDIDKIYRNWLRNPLVAEKADQWLPGVRKQPLEGRQYYNWVHEYSATSREGNNPLKAKIARTLNVDISRTGLSLAFYKGLIKPNSEIKNDAIAAIDQMLEKLNTAHSNLSTFHRAINDRAPSKENITAFRTMQKSLNSEVAQARGLEEIIRKNSNLLTERDAKLYKHREIPFLRPLDFGLTKKANSAYRKVLKQYEIN